MNGEVNALRRRYGGHTPGLMGAERSYAVLCPLVEKEDGAHFLFEVRARKIRQGGEVCFPGGRMERGESAEECALREMAEELSVPAECVTLLGMSDFLCNPRGFLLQPVLGLVSPAGVRAIRPSPAEVAEVFTVPLAFFRATEPEVFRYPLIPRVPDTFPYEAVGIPRDYPWSAGQTEVPVWHWGERVIWGMTARIVRDLMAGME